MSPACQSVVLYYSGLMGSEAHKRKAAMQDQRGNRIDNAGGNAVAGNWCCFAGYPLHGGESHLEHLRANPNGQQQKHKAGGVKVGEHSAHPNSDNHDRQGWPNDQEQNDWKDSQHSRLRLAALGRLALDKLRPDSLPVVRAKVLTCYRTFRGLLDSNAAFWRRLAVVVLVPPLADLIRVDLEQPRKLGSTRRIRQREICVQVHESHYRSTRSVSSSTFVLRTNCVAFAMVAA